MIVNFLVFIFLRNTFFAYGNYAFISCKKYVLLEKFAIRIFEIVFLFLLDVILSQSF